MDQMNFQRRKTNNYLCLAELQSFNATVKHLSTTARDCMDGIIRDATKLKSKMEEAYDNYREIIQNISKMIKNCINLSKNDSTLLEAKSCFLRVSSNFCLK